MNLVSMVLILSLYVPFTSQAHAATPKENKLAGRFLVTKEKVVKDEEFKREVLGSLYSINSKIKKMSEKKSKMTNRMLGVRANIRDLVQQTKALEGVLSGQKQKLSSRLKAMYMLGSESFLRVLFTAHNASSLDRNIKYLRALSEHDLELIKGYQKTLAALEQRKSQLRKEIVGLARVKERLRKQEQKLEGQQESKARILTRLRKRRAHYLSQLKKIRSQVDNNRGSTEDEGPSLLDLMDVAFFERKGYLYPPIDGEVTENFGLWIHPKYRYRLSHKGQFYQADLGTGVRSVFSGKVAFVGRVAGFGRTMIVDHGDHYYSVYSFLSKALVDQGQKLKEQQLIAKSGESWNQGPGMYFEIRHFSDAVDPNDWFSKNKIRGTY